MKKSINQDNINKYLSNKTRGVDECDVLLRLRLEYNFHSRICLNYHLLLPVEYVQYR